MPVMDKKTYPVEEWCARHAALHKRIDWAARGYEEYETSEIGLFRIYIHRYGQPVECKLARFHLVIRPNPIYPPYWRIFEEDMPQGVLNGMYDGENWGKYHIHNRFEDQRTYDMFWD